MAHCCPASREYDTASVSPGKEQNSKFEVWFLLNTYGFCTIIKVKNPKVSRLKSGTVCMLKCLLSNHMIGNKFSFIVSFSLTKLGWTYLATFVCFSVMLGDNFIDILICSKVFFFK